MTSARASAARQALAAAERLLDPGGIREPSLDGLAGTALLHARLSSVEPVFADAARRHWAAAIEQARHAPASSNRGIYASPAGIAASLILGTQYLPDPGRHETAVQHAVTWLSAQAIQITAGQNTRQRARKPVLSWTAYDLISGPAGIGRVLLAALTAGHTQAEPGLRAILTTLTHMISGSAGRPGW